MIPNLLWVYNCSGAAVHHSCIAPLSFPSNCSCLWCWRAWMLHPPCLMGSANFKHRHILSVVLLLFLLCYCYART